MLDIDAWCRAHDAKLAVVVLPRHFQYDAREAPQSAENADYEAFGPHAFEPFHYFDEKRTEAPFPIVSLLSDFQTSGVFPTCFEDDPHWNEAGHRVVARALVRELATLVGSL